MDKIKVQINSELEKLIPKYLKNRQKDIDQIKQSLADNDFGSIHTVGHNMSGSGGGYGFNEISEIGRNIEVASKEENKEEINKLLDQLQDYLSRLEIEYV